MEVAFNDSVIFEKYFRGPMVCFSHAGNPPEGYNLSADISQIYLTSVMKDQYLAKEQAGRGRNIHQVGGQEGQSCRPPRELPAPGPRFPKDVVEFLTYFSLAGDLSSSQKRLLETERIKKK